MNIAQEDKPLGGMTESRLRIAVAPCSLGFVAMAQGPKGIRAIGLGDDPEALSQELQSLAHGRQVIAADADLNALMAELVSFIELPARGLELPLDIRGTAFQTRVWQALCQIHPGESISYSELARRLGAPKAARAVARACAQNRLALAVPCHRVIARDGDISGYRWGVERKRELLRREAQLH